ncbi:MAG TPA: Holliday junction DNA helicase RuvB C-terminal domain-containing protein, partial [Patescibacteria group bacterium]|nr:Holliday junction DNA helicase RuvB C-terminal domain-containing protein [Patescibacteria group bacterium]
RDFAQTHDHDIIDETVTLEALSLLNIDTEGLEPVDRQILEIILKKFGGGPVGIQTIATATAEETQTIEDVYEPYLIQIGFLSRTPRGRIITERACRHLGYDTPKFLEQKSLL